VQSLQYTHKPLLTDSILSSASLADELENLIELLPLFLLRTALNGFGHTVLEMALEDAFLDLGQSTPDGVYLVQDVDAILAILDHPLDAPNLALDSPQGNQITVMTRILFHLKLCQFSKSRILYNNSRTAFQ
jgi:hypothetical protein